MKTILKLSTNGIHEISVMAEESEDSVKVFELADKLFSELKTRYKPIADPKPQQAAINDATPPFCETHGIAKIKIPAGVSKKTGKPYPSFWVCPRKDGHE